MTEHSNESGVGPSAVDGLELKLREFVRYIPDGTSIPAETWRGRHRNILVLLVAHLPFLFLLGMFDGTESLVTGATIPEFPPALVVTALTGILGFAAVARWSRLERRHRTGFATLGLLTASATLVYFSGGYIEAHFHFFVMMAVVAVYEDWLPFLLGIGYVAFQHGFFGMTAPGLVYNHAAAIGNPWAWAGIHATFVLGLAAALMTQWYSTERSREEAREQLEQAREMTSQVETLEEKNEQVEAARAEAEARQEEVERLNDHLQTKAEAYSAAMARAADGELTVRLDAESESDAMVRIAESFNEMMAETEAAMCDIQTFAREVATASEEADAGTGEIKGASEEVSQSIQGIASGADEQREMLEEVSTEMSQMSATIEEMAASAETVAGTSQETAEVAATGETTARDAIESAREVQTAIDSTAENVEALDEQMAEIGAIVELIADIAEQTNILALNANIEAARAGGGEGAGNSDGFAVVADEVKELADETQASASDIEQLITEVQGQTETTADEVLAAQRHVEQSVEAVQEVVDAFERVAANAAETDDGVQEIREATDDQAASAEEAVSTVEEVGDISRTTADEVGRVSAAAEEQASSMSQVSASVESLTDQAEQLQELLATFEVGDEGDGLDRADPAPDGDVAMSDGGGTD